MRADSTTGTRAESGPSPGSGIVQLASEPVGSGGLDLQSLTDVLVSCSGALTDGEVRTGEEDMANNGSPRALTTHTNRLLVTDALFALSTPITLSLSLGCLVAGISSILWRL